MSATKGLVFQTIPEELAQMIDHYAARFGVPANNVVMAAMTVMHQMIEAKHPQTLRFIEQVTDTYKRERDLAGLIVAREL